MTKSSDISGFYKLSPQERLQKVKEFADLTIEEAKLLANTGALELSSVNRMIENVVGTMPIPLGIAVNFLINSKDYLVPMAIEEPSVVAAASNAARMARASGGFFTTSTAPIMVGQIQVTDVSNPEKAKQQILANKDKLIQAANDKDPLLLKVGGGAKDIEVRILDSLVGEMVIVHLLVDCRDAMGPNAVNTMAEAIAPLIERITGGKVYLRIISNLAVYRRASAKAVFSKDAIGGEEVVDAILKAYAFAVADPFRCATHNRGIMNGISAVGIATGNDFRALEAGAHSYAAMNGKYKPLTTWGKDENGNLLGKIELPIAVGIIGGVTAVHPIAKINLKILGVKSAAELGQVMAAVGLAQNFAALKALATEGIQRGHMSLHARNIAITAGATQEEVDKVVEILVSEKKVRMDRAKEIIEELRKKK